VNNNNGDHDKVGRRPPLDFDLAHHCTSIRVDPGYSIRYVSCIFCYFVYITMSAAPITHQRYVEITWTEVHSGLSCTTSWEVLHVGELPWQPPRNFHPLPGSLQLSFPLCEWPILPLLFFLSSADVTSTLNNAMSFILSQLTMIFLPLLALLLSRNVTAQVTFVPPAVPLAVRSPYLNCWLQDGNATTLYGQTWPTTFNHSQVCHP
jgi:hypothetical protein